MTFIKKISFIFFLSAVGSTFFACGGGEASSTASEPETTTIDINAIDSGDDANDGKPSGILEPVKWSFESNSLGNDEFELKFTANMESGWSIYSQHTSDDGPVPTAFEFESENFTAVGDVQETGKKKEGLDPLFDVNVIKFIEGPVVFTQKVKVTDYSTPVSGYLTFMTCDDKRCLPPTDVDFEFALSK